jgi:hypothetical protein
VLAQFAPSGIEFERTKTEVRVGCRARHAVEYITAGMNPGILSLDVSRLPDETTIDTKLRRDAWLGKAV